ncbi:hypothetical protein Sjap_022944 [Stephania japonica]|uniref:Uncharacterized protein n=1 Tax=Stephania japonica TaxID=461633 RepID=A0AAP0ESV6_9MAGN
MMAHEPQMRMETLRNNNNNNKRKSSYREKRSSIEIGKVEEVDFSGMALYSLPTTPNLMNIHKLDLSNNNLESIPESLTARMLSLVVLDVHSNQLKALPNSIGCLSKLKTLNFSNNLIQSLPKTIENCRSLEELNGNFNQLRQLPDTIGFELLNLQRLYVNSNKLALLPYSISHLTNLRILDVRLNCLRSLPDDLENLINLEILNVSQNFQYLVSIPYSVGLLMSLVELDVSYNKITTLPESIGCSRKLNKLSVEGNPLVSPPMEVVEQSLQAVKEYLSEKMNGGHKSTSMAKKSSWLGKLVKCGTFNGPIGSDGPREERYAFSASDYRSIDGLASPKYMGMFSPKRLFSPKSYFAR